MFRRIKEFTGGIKWLHSPDTEERPGTLKQETTEQKPSVTRVDCPDGRAFSLFPVSLKAAGGDKWGYMNAKGNFYLPPIYEHAGDFQENGLAIVQLNHFSGLIDLTGYFIVKPKYEKIHPFSEGRATVIDRSGFQVIDERGKEITAKAYAFIGNFKGGRAVIAIKDKAGHYLYGYLNRRGKEVLPPVYEAAGDFHDGKAIVKLTGESYALINLTGKVLCKFPYAYAGSYGEGLLAFQKNYGDSFGYMDEAGNAAIEPKFSSAQPFIGGRAIVSVSGGTKDYYGLIDRKGNFIFKPNYHLLLDLGEGRIAIGKASAPEKPFIGSKFAIGDKNGHILTGFIYNGVTQFTEGRASACDDHSTFFIDHTGKKLQSLPTVGGSGKLRIDKTLIKGEIDFRLRYFDKKGKQVWKQNTIISLAEPYAVIEKKYKSTKDFIVYYPEITGIRNLETQTKVNQALKDLAGIKETPPHLQLESNYMGDFEIPFFQKFLLVIEIAGYDYPFGATQGMPVKKYAHIDLETGEIYQLKNLFKPGSQYVKVISELIGNQINTDKKYSGLFPASFKGIQSDQPFFISNTGLNLYFPTYELAPFAGEFLTSTIPFEELLQIINQRGTFWKSFH